VAQPAGAVFVLRAPCAPAVERPRRLQRFGARALGARTPSPTETLAGEQADAVMANICEIGGAHGAGCNAGEQVLLVECLLVVVGGRRHRQLALPRLGTAARVHLRVAFDLAGRDDDGGFRRAEREVPPKFELPDVDLATDLRGGRSPREEGNQEARDDDEAPPPMILSLLTGDPLTI